MCTLWLCVSWDFVCCACVLFLKFQIMPRNIMLKYCEYFYFYPLCHTDIQEIFFWFLWIIVTLCEIFILFTPWITLVSRKFFFILFVSYGPKYMKINLIWWQLLRIFLEWWLRICLLKDNIGLLLFVIMARSTRINETKARKELIVESTDSIEPENMQNEPVNNECNKGKIENTYVVSSMKRITFFTHYTDIYIYIYIRSLHSYTAILHI